MNILAQLQALAETGNSETEDPRAVAIQQVAEKGALPLPSKDGVSKAIQDLINKSGGNYQQLRKNPQYRKLEDSRSNYEPVESGADEFGGRLDNPDLPSQKDLRSVKDQFDEDVDTFAERFGRSQQEDTWNGRTNRDPKTGLRKPDYVPLPRSNPLPRNRTQQDDQDRNEELAAHEQEWRNIFPLEKRQEGIPTSVMHPEMDYDEYRTIRDHAWAARGELAGPPMSPRLTEEQLQILNLLDGK